MIWIFGDSFVAPKKKRKYFNEDVIPWFTKFGPTKNFASEGRGPKDSMSDFLTIKDSIIKSSEINNDIIIFVLSSANRNFNKIDLDLKYYNVKNLGFLYLFHTLYKVKFFIMFKSKNDFRLIDTSIFNSKDFYVLNFPLSSIKHPNDYGDNVYVNHLCSENHKIFENLFQDFLDEKELPTPYDVKKYNFHFYNDKKDTYIYD